MVSWQKLSEAIGSATPDPEKGGATTKPVPPPAVANKPPPGRKGPVGLQPRQTYSRVNTGAPPAPDAGTITQKSQRPRGLEFLPAKVAQQEISMTTMMRRPSLHALVKEAMEGTASQVDINTEAMFQQANIDEPPPQEKTASAYEPDVTPTSYVEKLASALYFLSKQAGEGTTSLQPGVGPGALQVMEATSSEENYDTPDSGQAKTQIPLKPPMSSSGVAKDPPNAMQDNIDMSHPEQPVEPISNEKTGSVATKAKGFFQRMRAAWKAGAEGQVPKAAPKAAPKPPPQGPYRQAAPKPKTTAPPVARQATQKGLPPPPQRPPQRAGKPKAKPKDTTSSLAKTQKFEPGVASTARKYYHRVEGLAGRAGRYAKAKEQDVSERVGRKFMRGADLGPGSVTPEKARSLGRKIIGGTAGGTAVVGGGGIAAASMGGKKGKKKKSSAPANELLLRNLMHLGLIKSAEDAINPASIGAGPTQTGATPPAGATPSEEGVPSEPSDVTRQKKMVSGNDAAIDYTKGQAKADPKSDVNQVLNEPALTSATDKVLQNTLDATPKAGVKISHVRRDLTKTAAAQALLSKIAQEAEEERKEERKKNGNKEKESQMGSGGLTTPAGQSGFQASTMGM